MEDQDVIDIRDLLHLSSPLEKLKSVFKAQNKKFERLLDLGETANYVEKTYPSGEVSLHLTDLGLSFHFSSDGSFIGIINKKDLPL